MTETAPRFAAKKVFEVRRKAANHKSGHVEAAASAERERRNRMCRGKRHDEGTEASKTRPITLKVAAASFRNLQRANTSCQKHRLSLLGRRFHAPSYSEPPAS